MAIESALLNLLEGGTAEEFKSFLKKNDVGEITKCIKLVIKRGKEDPVKLIRCILKASDEPTDDNIERCSQIYITVISLIQKNEISSKTAFSIISMLMIEADSLQPASLGKVTHFFVDSVKCGSYNGGKVADLLPKLLFLINTCEVVPCENGHITGCEYKSHIINKLCSVRWAPTVAVHMAALFHDIPLSLEETRFVMEKILRALSDIDLPDQPAIVFQLLLLSSKGHKRLVLEGITRHFTSLDDENRERSIMIDSEDLLSDSVCLTTLRQIEGTVILHITQSVKQDQELGSELMKYIKNLQLLDSSKVISPFNLSLLLSLSQLHHFSDQILDFLKSSVLRSLQDEERQEKSLWVRECYKVAVKTEALILEAVEHSSYDWDQVVPGLVRLGFGLMDSFGPKLVFGQLPEAVSSEGHMTPAQLACQLGQRMLLKTFKTHEVVRSEILDQIFKYIIMKSSSPVSHYLALLSDTVHSAPQLLLESSNKVQEVFLKLAILPVKSAQSLLTAIQPLLKLAPLLKDTLILVLRKAMFSRQISSRTIGALGFLMILKHFHVIGGLPSSQASQPFALSQIQADVHARYNAASNEALCLEIVGNLRRCFTQQADIRMLIYQGFYDVLYRNSQLKNPVLDMLLSQLKKYYEQNEDCSTPLRLEACLVTQGDEVYLAEPLAHLLACTQQCVRKAVEIEAAQVHQADEDDAEGDENTEDQQALSQLQQILSTLTKRIIEAEMEDFELDKSADFSLSNSVGMKNNIYAVLLLGLYEVLMEYNFMAANKSCKQVMDLFTNYQKLSTVMREKGQGSNAKKARPTNSKTPSSLLTLNCNVEFLKTILGGRDILEDMEELRSNKDFLPYLVSVATSKLGQLRSKGTCDGSSQNNEKDFIVCCVLARLFHTHYIETQSVEDGGNHRDQKLTTSCLEGLGQVIDIACSHGKESVVQCLHFIEKEPEEKKPHLDEKLMVEKIHAHIKKFQRLASTILSLDHEYQVWKDMSTLIVMIEQLSRYLPRHGAEYQQVYTWVLKQCTDGSVGDVTVCKLLLSTLLNLARETKSLPHILRHLCQDVHSQLGDIAEDTEVDNKTHYTVTQAANCPPSTVLSLTLIYLDQELDDVDWVVRRHKASMLGAATTADEDNVPPTQVEQIEKSVCTRLGVLVTAFIELCHACVPNKSCSQALLKSLTKLYSSLTNLTKHYISMYTNKAGHLNPRFEKLVTLVGKQMTQPTYSMIMFVQMAVEDSKKGEKKDNGKKSAKASSQAGLAKTVKTIPNLIFAIEQLEKFLIQLSKKSKVNLMENIKLSVSRDFRIIAETVSHQVEQDEVSSDNESDSDQEEDPEKDNENGDDTGEENIPPDQDEEEGNSEEISSSEPPQKKKKINSSEPSLKKKKLSSKGAK